MKVSTLFLWQSKYLKPMLFKNLPHYKKYIRAQINDRCSLIELILFQYTYYLIERLTWTVCSIVLWSYLLSQWFWLGQVYNGVIDRVWIGHRAHHRYNVFWGILWQAFQFGFAVEVDFEVLILWHFGWRYNRDWCRGRENIGPSRLFVPEIS